MAPAIATTTATAAAVSPAVLCVQNMGKKSPHYFSLTKRGLRLSILTRTSNSDYQNDGAKATQDEPETGKTTVVEVPKGPPSLISTLNVEKALRGIAITDVDHYARLGLQPKCSYDEVRVAYKNKVAEVSDKGLSEEELSKELELLKESEAILSSVEERRMYDWCMARSGNPDRYMWPFEVDITQTPTAMPPPREPEDEGPTRLVGYFFLGWLMLSFVLLIVLS